MGYLYYIFIIYIQNIINFIYDSVSTILSRYIKYLLKVKFNYFLKDLNNININLVYKNKNIIINIQNIYINEKYLNSNNNYLNINTFLLKEINIHIPINILNLKKILFEINNIQFDFEIHKKITQQNQKKYTLVNYSYDFKNNSEINIKKEKSIELLNNLIYYTINNFNFSFKNIEISNKKYGILIKKNVIGGYNLNLLNINFNKINICINEKICLESDNINIIKNNNNISIQNKTITCNLNKYVINTISNFYNKLELSNEPSIYKINFIFNSIIINYYTDYVFKLKINKLVNNNIQKITLNLIHNKLSIPTISISSFLFNNKKDTEKYIIDNIKIYIYNKIVPILYKFIKELNYSEYIIDTNNKSNLNENSINEIKNIKTFFYIRNINALLFDFDVNDKNISRIFNNKSKLNNIHIKMKDFNYNYNKDNGIVNYNFNVKETEIIDNVNNSLWNKFFYSSNEKLLSINITKYLQNKLDINIVILPITFNIDEDCLFFLIKNINSNIYNDLSDPYLNSIFYYIKKFHLDKINVNLSYKPKKINWNDLFKGDVEQIFQIGEIHNNELLFSEIKLYNIKNMHLLVGEIKNNLFNDFKDNGALKWLTNIEPLHYITNIFNNFQIILNAKSLNKGCKEVLYNVTDNFFELSTRTLVGAQSRLEDLTSKKETKSKYYDPPTNFIDGIKKASSSIKQVYNDCKNSNITTKSLLLKPFIGVTEATAKTLMGLHNEIYPTRVEMIENRYGNKINMVIK
jgi:hypothetical protein